MGQIMTNIVLMKTSSNTLVPADHNSAVYSRKLKLGVGVDVKAKRYNNVKFHNKLFKLVEFAYDVWEPGEKEYKGVKIEKNFDQFREDITILAGFYTTSIRVNGDIRFNAKSWSFSSMDDVEKEKLYNSIINAVLKHVLKNYTRDDIDKVIDGLMRFDG